MGFVLMYKRQLVSLLFLFFSFSSFAKDYSYSTQESYNIINRLVQALPTVYNYDGFIENTRHSYVTHFEPSFFEALKHNQYLHPSGRNFTEAEKREIYNKLVDTSRNYIENSPNLVHQYEKFEAETYTHILRNKVLRVQLAIQLEQLNIKLAEFHDRLKLVADVSELHKLGYPMEIKSTILDFLVANQKFKKNDISDGQLLVRDKNGDVFRLPLAFAIHEVNRLEKNEVYSFFINNNLAERLSNNRVRLYSKAIVSEIFDIITDHIDAISRKDLGNPNSLTSASKYLSNLKKTPAIELKALLEALNSNLGKMTPVFEYFEAQGHSTYKNLVSDKINRIVEFVRGLNPHSLSCYMLFQ